MGEDVEIKNIDNRKSKRKNISQKTSSTSSTTTTNIETTMETNKRTPSRLAKVQEEVLFSANNFNLSLPFISNYPLVCHPCLVADQTGETLRWEIISSSKYSFCLNLYKLQLSCTNHIWFITTFTHFHSTGTGQCN